MNNGTHGKDKLYITFSGDIESIFKPLRQTGYIEVGILGQSKKTKKNEVPVAYYGSVHEFGDPSHNIPMRSFLRRPIQKNLPKILQKNFNKIMQRIYTGQAEQVLNDIGNDARNIVINSFKSHGADGEWPPLTEETIRRKTVNGRKGDAPLIDTGNLRLSIDYKVVLTKKG